MLIHEVCEKSSLTKKAVEYYEKQGLVQPEIGTNGYRNYSERDLSTLKEIAVLRKIGLSISEIKHVFSSDNRTAVLTKYKYLLDLKKERATEQQKSLELLIENIHIDKVKDYIDLHLNTSFTIREKLVHAFPGAFGMYLAVHFGPFLNETLDTPEKEMAYERIVNYLDRLNIPRELEERIGEFMPNQEYEEMEKMSTAMKQGLNHIEGYIKENRENIEEYLKFRYSKDFQATSAYKLQQLLSEFLTSNGYEEHVIQNLKILSSSYREYSEKLHAANEWFMKEFPGIKE